MRNLLRKRIDRAQAQVGLNYLLLGTARAYVLQRGLSTAHVANEICRRTARCLHLSTNISFGSGRDIIRNYLLHSLDNVFPVFCIGIGVCGLLKFPYNLCNEPLLLFVP